MVAILPQTLPVDEEFVTKAKQEDTPPEQRFRFANKCVENGCSQWNGNGCGVVEEVVQYLNQIPATLVLPACPIRVNCRWFLQKGPDACAICPYIITEITAAEVMAQEA